jgi:hypothetical protein
MAITDFASEITPPNQPTNVERPVCAMNSAFAWVFWAFPTTQVLKRYTRASGTWVDVSGFDTANSYTDIAASDSFLWLAGRSGGVINNPKVARQDLNTQGWSAFTPTNHNVRGTVMIVRRPGTSTLYLTYITVQQGLFVQKSTDNGATWSQVASHTLLDPGDDGVRRARAQLMGVAVSGGDAAVTWVDVNTTGQYQQWNVFVAKESGGWSKVQMNATAGELRLLSIPGQNPQELVRSTFGDYLVTILYQRLLTRGYWLLWGVVHQQIRRLPQP